jgi:hypothetical protein
VEGFLKEYNDHLKTKEVVNLWKIMKIW